MEVEPDRIHCVIEGIEFTLFYDYDELRDRKLYRISDMGRIEWFERRMNVVFLEPLRRIFDQGSRAHKELCSNEKEYEPVRTVMIMAFSVLLNGVDSLGSFLLPLKVYGINAQGERVRRSPSHKERFTAFVERMPKRWGKIGHELWRDFRNGIAHQFVVENGGIEFKRGTDYWYESCNSHNVLKVEPVTFFRDFESTAQGMFKDIRNDSTAQRLFLRRFEKAYPKQS